MGQQCLRIIRVRAPVPRNSFFSGQQCLRIIRVWAPVPRNSLFSGQQCLRIIRVRAPVPRNSLFSGQQCLRIIRVRAPVPRNSLFSGQQCLRIIRVWAPVPRIPPFGPAAPLDYSMRASVPQIIFFGPAASQLYLGLGFGPLESHFLAISVFVLFGLRSFKSLLRAINTLRSKYPNLGGNIPVRMSYVKYEGKSTVYNTRWPGIRIKRALPRNFPYLRYEVCTDERIGCLAMNWASTW
jgi:hypothetical protein